MDFTWALHPITTSSLRTCDPTITNEDKKYEREWGNMYIKSTNDNGNWTTKLGEGVVKKLFEISGVNIWKPTRKNGMEPDWETDKFIIEVKWCLRCFKVKEVVLWLLRLEAFVRSLKGSLEILCACEIHE